MTSNKQPGQDLPEDFDAQAQHAQHNIHPPVFIAGAPKATRTVGGHVLPIPKPPGLLALAAVPKPAKRKSKAKAAQTGFSDA